MSISDEEATSLQSHLPESVRPVLSKTGKPSASAEVKSRVILQPSEVGLGRNVFF